MRNPEYRFIFPEGVQGHKLVTKVEVQAGNHKNDFLKSMMAAQAELERQCLQLNTAFEDPAFSDCASQSGYSDGIGFKCGRHKECAACPICSYVQRLQLVDLPERRKMQAGRNYLITIFDKRQPIGKLNEYRPEDLITKIQKIAKLAKEAQGQIRAIGHVEYTIKPAPSSFSKEPEWAPHIHIIATGVGVEKFLSLCRYEFPLHRKNTRTVQSKEIKTTFDKAYNYIFKAPFAKHKDRLHFTADREIELSRHLLNRTCSDLLWTFGMYLKCRTVIASNNDILIWNYSLGRHPPFIGSNRLRRVPTIQRKWKVGLIGADGKINVSTFRIRSTYITAKLKSGLRFRAYKRYRELQVYLATKTSKKRAV